MGSDLPRARVKARTMADIAALAGVAGSTVSRALAGSNRVSEQTRLRILDLVRESGYRVNARARSLRLQRSRTIEIVIATAANRRRFSDPLCSQIVVSVADALAEKGYDLLLSHANPWADDVPGADALASSRADGIIFIGQGRDPAPLARYASEHPNVVVWGADVPDRTYAVVGGDDFRGGELVGRRLMALGRRRVVFLGDVGRPEIGLRHRGLAAALSSAGAAPDQTLTLSTPFDAASAHEATRNLFRSGATHDSIFAAGDVMAIAAMQALMELGVRVPADVAVVGYDDIPLAAFASPALTTVRQDAGAGGAALVERLLAIIEGGERRDVVLPTELIVRRSCGAGSAC
jgi:DNA-binding LacI/PurR family transcriptional regulator